MYDIPFVRFAFPCAILFLFYWFLIENPLDQTDISLQIPPEEAQLLRRKALKLMEEKRFGDALEPLTKLHQASPDSHIYHNDLGLAYHALGRYGEEVKMWELFMQHAPVPGDACPQITEAYRALGKTVEVMSSVKKCFDFDPSNSDSIFFYAHELERRGQSAEALKLYEKGHVLAPNYPDIAIGMVRTLSALGRDADARKLIDDVIAKRPTNTDALLAAGIVYSRLGQRAVAIHHLKRVLEIAPTYREAETMLRTLGAPPAK